jgi:hypothetical protein
MPSKRKVLLLSASLVPLAAVLALLLLRPPRPRAAADWTPERLHEALTRAGLAYEARAAAGSDTQDAGLYLKRAGDRRPWAEIVALPRSVPQFWRGCLVVRTVESEISPVREREGCVVFGPLVLYGDSAEIRRVLKALR